MSDFGKLLRSMREAAGVTMGELARHLGISVTFLSDVERGVRAPLSPERVIMTAALLKLNGPKLSKLDQVAAESRGVFELGAKNLSPTASEVGATLMRGWPQYTDDDFQKLKALLEELGDGA